MLVGGLAVNLHGVPRLTGDLDLCLALDLPNVKSFLSLLEELGYGPRIPADPLGLADEEVRRRWREEKGMAAFTFWHPEAPFAEVDVLLWPEIPFEELWSARARKPLGGTEVSLASIPHLKRLKSATGRRQDLADIEALDSVERLSRSPESGRGGDSRGPQPGENHGGRR